MKKRKVIYSVLICILLVLIGICSFFVYYFFDLNNNEFTDEIIINEKSKMDYTVKLIDNDYYDQNSISSNYLTNKLDKVQNHYNYSVSFSESVKGTYTYNVIGSLIIKDENNLDSDLLNLKVFNQKEKQTDINSNLINISDTFDIDVNGSLKKYQEMKEKFVTLDLANLKTISYIEYRIFINYNVYNSLIDKNIENNKELFIRVPLSDETSKIVTSKSINDRYKKFSEKREKDTSINLVICAEFAGAIILFILVIVSLMRELSKEDRYEVYKREILNKYNKYIKKIDRIPNLEKYDVLFVKSLKDLTEAADSLNTKIIYKEIKKGRESTFILTNEKKAYVYKLKKNDIEVKKK